MRNLINKSVIVIIAGLFTSTVFAANSNLEQARENIPKRIPGVQATNITLSPVEGLYQVSMPPKFFYASVDGRYIVDGDLIDLKNNENISKNERNHSVAAAIEAMGKDTMITFGKDSLKHSITVFTDIDCGYCRKLHHEVAEYNKLGIQVRYMAYPRAGLGSSAFKKAEAVWCSKDKTKAMTLSKDGEEVASDKCVNPVAKHYALGNQIGIRGTPAIILEDGTLIPGYVPAARLSQALDQQENN